MKRKITEAIIITTVAIALFGLARIAGVAERGSTLWGGEIMVPFFVIGGWYGVKSIIKDIKGREG